MVSIELVNTRSCGPICSMALWEGSAARDYWSTVELTADLTKVGWLWE